MSKRVATSSTTPRSSKKTTGGEEDQGEIGRLASGSFVAKGPLEERIVLAVRVYDLVGSAEQPRHVGTRALADHDLVHGIRLERCAVRGLRENTAQNEARKRHENPGRRDSSQSHLRRLSNVRRTPPECTGTFESQLSYDTGRKSTRIGEGRVRSR
jgi:hypothetical protein